MPDDYGEKTEAPTPRRRQESREQGNIARSPDLAAAALLLAIIFMLDWYGPGLITALRALMEQAMSLASLRDSTCESAFVQMLLAMRVIAVAMAPLLVGVLITAVLVNLLQVGFFLSLKRLQPRLSSLNPFKGLNKIFSRDQGPMHLVMSMLKLLLVGLVAYSAVHGKIAMILATQQLSVIQVFGLSAQIIYSIALRIGAVLLVLALLDYAWQKWRHERRMKMSKYEVKEEMRRMEGDPQIKSRRRQVALQRFVQGIRRDVPTADVVVTNPTEFAVALKYDPDTMNAPKVVAKGQGYFAMMIRQTAAAYGVPILERPPLARALFRLVEIGQEVPEQFYAAVAEILAYVYELSGRHREERQYVAT